MVKIYKIFKYKFYKGKYLISLSVLVRIKRINGLFNLNLFWDLIPEETTSKYKRLSSKSLGSSSG